MDASGFSNQAIRNEQLQRLLKKFELEAHISLRGPAVLSAGLASGAGLTSNPSTAGASGLCQTQAQRFAGNGTFIKPEMETAVSKQCVTKSVDEGTHSSSSSSARVGRKDQSKGADGRLLAVDRSVIQSQEALLKDIFTLKRAIPVQPLPALTARDRAPSASERKECLLEGEIITCFVVGGEKRLCLPQVLTSVLKSVPMVDINQASSELNIHCGYCTPEQLLALKIAGVVSATTASSALITKTDAERLCDYLLRQRHNYRTVAGPPSQGDKKYRPSSVVLPASGSRSRPEMDKTAIFHSGSSSRSRLAEASEGANAGIGVTHYCFGRCRGRYFPSLYVSPSAECIECDECHQLFAPDRFVVHSHGNQERRTCHWGFDSANWRAYLHTTEKDEGRERTKILDQMKSLFDITGATKRRMEPNNIILTGSSKLPMDTDDQQRCSKRLRLDGSEQVLHKPAVDTNAISIGKEANLKAPVALTTAPSHNPPVLDQSGLSYLLCDPVLLASYCQPALHNLLSSCFAAAIRAAAAQTGNPAASLIPPILPTTASTLPAPQLSQHTAAGNNLLLDGYGVQAKRHAAEFAQRESPKTTREGTLDEATAVAALKLLQLHAGTNGDIAYGAFAASADKQNSHKFTVGESDPGKDFHSTVLDSQGSDVSNLVKQYSQQQHCSSLPFGKEPFKKQLLHLFTVEQQQKEVQRRQDEQRKESPKQKDLAFGRPVEVIAEDRLSSDRQLPRQSASRAESEKLMGDESSTPDTQVAEELSVSSSDNEGATGELTLDALLRQYITNSGGLKLVRSKIAENQRYLEQKLDAVCAENRLLYAECQQLRLKLLQQRQQKQSVVDEGTNVLVRDAMKKLNGLLPEQYVR